MHQFLGEEALSIVLDNAVNDKLIENEKLRRENDNNKTVRINGSHRNQRYAVGSFCQGFIDTSTLPGRKLWTIPMSTLRPISLGALEILDFVLGCCTIESSRAQPRKSVWAPNDNKEGVICISFGPESRMVIVTGKITFGTEEQMPDSMMSRWDWLKKIVKSEYKGANSYKFAMARVGTAIFMAMHSPEFTNSSIEISSVSVRFRNVKDMLETVNMTDKVSASIKQAIREDISNYTFQFCISRLLDIPMQNNWHRI